MVLRAFMCFVTKLNKSLNYANTITNGKNMEENRITTNTRRRMFMYRAFFILDDDLVLFLILALL